MIPDQITSERNSVVAEAMTWLGTPYHHAGRVKGGGVDCATLVYLSFINPGVLPEFPIESYPHDWYMHRDQERYLAYLIDRASEMPQPSERTPLPGDVIMWKYGRLFSHGGIVQDWPNVIHAYCGKKVMVGNAVQDRFLSTIGEKVIGQGQPRPLKIFTMSRWIIPEDQELTPAAIQPTETVSSETQT